MFADSHGSAARRQGNQSSYILQESPLILRRSYRERRIAVDLFIFVTFTGNCAWLWLRLESNGQLEKTSWSLSQRLTQQYPERCRINTAVYAVEIWDRQGSRSGANVHSDYAMMTIMTMMIWRSSTLWNIAAEWQHSVFRDSLCRRPRPKFASIMHEQTSLTIWHNATQACLTLPEECRQRLLTDADENTSKDVIDDGDHGDFSLEYRNTQAERRIWHQCHCRRGLISLLT